MAADGPLYQQLYQQLCAAIQNGQYPVHSSFPTEVQLCAQYGVSRHTVREATRRMVEEGLISKQPGAGSVVRATQPVVPYVLTSESTFQDAMTYGDSTRLEVLASQRKEADAALAAILHCPQRSVWMELTAMRHPTGQVSPMSYSQIYLRPAFAEIIAHLHGDHPSIYTLLKTLCGVEADSIRQRIEADLMPACSCKSRPNSRQLGRFFMYQERNPPSKSSYGLSAWEISTVSFISMLRPICRPFGQKLRKSSLTFLSLTPSRPS